MTAQETEQTLTWIFASAFSLAIDINIFRGFLPDHAVNALGVIVDGFANGNYPGNCQEISFQLLGRYESRQEAMELCREIDNFLPRYSTEIRQPKQAAGQYMNLPPKGKRSGNFLSTAKQYSSGKIDGQTKISTST